MREYRDLNAQPETEIILATDAGRVRLHTTLATRYCGVPIITVRTPSRQTPLPVEQEFNAYALSIPSPEDTHPLAFWEVRSIICL